MFFSVAVIASAEGYLILVDIFVTYVMLNVDTIAGM